MRLLIGVIVLLLISPVFSLDYYASVNVIINDDGSVIINGPTNYPELVGSSQELTSKNGEYWTFNLTINDVFSDYIIKVILPKGGQINYLNSTSSVKIGSEGGNVIVTNVGFNESINLIIQYTVSEINDLMIFYYFTGFLGISLIIYSLINREKKGVFDYSLLTERQAWIMRLINNNGRMTQKDLELKLGIPKSALSRNIDSLVRKGLITKEKKGMSNILIPVLSR